LFFDFISKLTKVYYP